MLTDLLSLARRRIEAICTVTEPNLDPLVLDLNFYPDDPWLLPWPRQPLTLRHKSYIPSAIIQSFPARHAQWRLFVTLISD